MIEINKIYNEDCLKTLAMIPDDKIDLVLTSPPYNMNLRIQKGKYISRQILKEEFSTKYEDFDDNIPIDEFYELHSGILKELIRTSKIIFYNIQIVTGSKQAFFKMIGEFHKNLKDIIIWDKVNSQPAMQTSVINRRCEILLIFEKPEFAISRQYRVCNFERGTMDDIWEIKRGKKYTNSHSAVFPEELVYQIISNFSNKNDLIYDPFSGSGTVAKCAKVLERNFIGSEISKNYFNASVNRIQEIITDL